MRVGVHTRDQVSSNVPVIQDVLERMARRGVELLLTPALASQLQAMERPVQHAVLDPQDLVRSDLDLMIGLGGDGTLLDTVDVVGRTSIPLLGINLGRLGFLANTRLEEVDSAMIALMNGRYALQDRALLEVTDHKDLLGDHDLALNEVSIHKRDSASMIAVHVHLGSDFLNTYWADGLIISTPTGSTAYSLSCGGPVLYPTSDVLVITPIAPHNLNVRPFVVPDHYSIRLQLEARSDRCLLNLDSRSVSIDGQGSVTIRRAAHVVKMVQFEGQDFLETLRTKLNWGLDQRSVVERSGA